MVKLSHSILKEKVDFAKRYMGEGNPSSLSEVDANANVERKNVATLAAEINKDTDVQINRFALGEKIEEMFGSEVRERYYRQLENHDIYAHDESSVFCKPYCVAIDLYPFIQKGMLPLGGDSQAPKHLDSFCGSYVNLIFSISSQFAGAVADVSFLTYFDYFARKDYGDNYLQTHTNLITNKFQHVLYTLNQPAAARGYQAVFYNTSIFDKYYFDSLFGNVYFPDGTNPKYESVAALQIFFMKWFNKERQKALLTFPVMTAAFQTEKGKAKDVAFKEFLAEEMSGGNSFFIYSSENIDSLSSCCRLKSNIVQNVFTYTLGGTGLATGSKKVFTINVNRLIQTGGQLLPLIDDLHKYLVAYDAILRDMQKAKMLPVYDAGFISLDKQYLTLGVNGIVEAAEYLGMDISYNEEYMQWVKAFLGGIKDKNQEDSKRYTEQYGHKIMFNTEFVPAENLGVKFAKWDKKAGLKVPRDCYNSYLYIVEDDSIDFIEKFKMHGEEVLQYLDGGSAYHLNLMEHPNKEAWLKIIDIATKYGCNYFTYNVRSTVCNKCGFISKQDKPRCVSCGSEDVDHATRIIGYLKRISSFSADRQKEAGLRFYHRDEA